MMLLFGFSTGWLLLASAESGSAWWITGLGVELPISPQRTYVIHRLRSEHDDSSNTYRRSERERER
jgi:hypothetical protein